MSSLPVRVADLTELEIEPRRPAARDRGPGSAVTKQAPPPRSPPPFGSSGGWHRPRAASGAWLWRRLRVSGPRFRHRARAQPKLLFKVAGPGRPSRPAGAPRRRGSPAPGSNRAALLGRRPTQRGSGRRPPKRDSRSQPCGPGRAAAVRYRGAQIRPRPEACKARGAGFGGPRALGRGVGRGVKYSKVPQPAAP